MAEVFRDDPALSEQAERYRRFLELQNEADGLTDEEYLEKMDEISGDEFLYGAYFYGYDEYGTFDEVSEEEARRRYEQEFVDEYGSYADGDGYLDTVDEYGNVIPYDEYGEIPEEDTGFDAGGYGFETGAGYDEYGEPVDVIDPYEEDDAAEEENEAEDGIEVSDGEAFEEPAAEGDEYTAHDTGPMNFITEPEAVNDGPEIEIESDGVTQPEIENDGPEAAYVPAFDDEEPQGEWVTQKEFVAHDILDEVSLATGLAGCVETAEYIPPKEAEVQEQRQPEAPQPGPAMRELNRQVERMDGPSVQKQPEGPQIGT